MLSKVHRYPWTAVIDRVFITGRLVSFSLLQPEIEPEKVGKKPNKYPILRKENSGEHERKMASANMATVNDSSFSMVARSRSRTLGVQTFRYVVVNSNA